MDTCRHCGGRMDRGARFCPRCLTPPLSESEVESMLWELDAAGRWRPPRRPLPAFKPDDRHTSPQLFAYSRWIRTSSTFGPLGRILITLGILAVGLAGFLISPSPGSGLIFLVVSVWPIKETWRKAHVVLRADDAPAYPDQGGGKPR